MCLSNLVGGNFMEDVEVLKFFIEYKCGTMKYFTDFTNGSVEISKDGWITTVFERDIEYSDKYDYGYLCNYDLPKSEIYKYKINPWEIQKVFFNRYDLLSLKSSMEYTSKEEADWNIIIETDKELINLKGNDYPEPYGKEFFDGLKELVKYKLVPDLK